MSTAAPFFVVGCARSGTTLVRMMLTSHPHVAVPPESHFVVAMAPSDPSADFPVEQLLQYPRVAPWALDADAVRAAEQAIGPWDYPRAVRAVFEAYAAAQGKPRWGDKTPGYVEHLPLLARLFPDARFVHVIRDGREVAASLAEWPWGPASPEAGGFWWRRKVGIGRRDGGALGDRYREVRLEDLVADPEGELAGLCRFLDLDVAPSMLAYPDQVQDLMTKPAETWLALTHPHLLEPPTANLRDWRSGLSPRRQRAVTAACGPLLELLGYAPDDTGVTDVASAWVQRLAAAARTARRDLAARRRGADREV